MRKFQMILRAECLLLACILFLTNSLFAAQIETNFWKDRQERLVSARLTPSMVPHSILSSPLSNTLSQRRESPLKKLSIDSLKNLKITNGVVRRISLPASSASHKVVFYLQDVHRNSEAQKNMSLIVADLIRKQSIGFIGLEGASRKFNLKGFHFFPYQEALRNAANYFLEKGEVSGVLHQALINSAQIPVIGVDDDLLYNAHISTLKKSILLKPQTSSEILAWKNKLQSQSREINSSLIKFSELVRLYKDGKISLGNYAQSLVKVFPQVSLNFQIFLEASSIEEKLNLTQVENERLYILNKLSQKMSDAELKSLVELSQQFRDKSIDPVNFYRQLENWCQSKGIDLKKVPNLQNYIKYIVLSEGIQTEDLMMELTKVEKAATSFFIKNQKEESWVRESQLEMLSERLVNFELTRAEWSEYLGLKKSTKTPLETVNPFENFYVLAESRDVEMAKRFLSILNKNNFDTALLMTGGFHASGVESILKENGVGVICITPVLTKINQGESLASLTIFAQKKTPIENIFKGERLFLCPPQLESLQNITVATVASSIHSHPTENPQSLFKILIQNSTKSVFISSKNFLSRAKLTIHRFSNWAQVSFDFASDGKILSSNEEQGRAQDIFFGLRQIKKTAFLIMMSVVLFVTLSFGQPLSISSIPPVTALKWVNSTNAAFESIQNGWLKNFKDPFLEQLILEGLKNNNDLKITAARIEEAQASLRIARAGQLPSLDMSIEGITPFRDLKNDKRQRGGGILGFNLGWELDFWGRIRAEKNAARASAQATFLNHQQAQQSLAGFIAKTYFIVIGIQEEIKLIDEEIKFLTTGMNKVDSFDQIGMGHTEDIHLIKSRLALAKNQRLKLHAQLKESARSLEILLGRYPQGDLALPKSTFGSLPQIPVGIPSEIIHHRLDLQSSWKTVESYFQKEKSAKRGRLPRFSLTSSAESSVGISDSIHSFPAFFLNAGANMVEPILDWGRKAAEVRGATAREKVAIAEHVKKVVNAFAEVEEALSNEQILNNRKRMLSESIEETQKVVDVLEGRAFNGLGRLYDSLREKERFFSTERERSQVQRDEIINQINLYLGLGINYAPIQQPTMPVKEVGLRSPNTNSKTEFHKGGAFLIKPSIKKVASEKIVDRVIPVVQIEKSEIVSATNLPLFTSFEKTNDILGWFEEEFIEAGILPRKPFEFQESKTINTTEEPSFQRLKFPVSLNDESLNQILSVLTLQFPDMGKEFAPISEIPVDKENTPVPNSKLKDEGGQKNNLDLASDVKSEKPLSNSTVSEQSNTNLNSHQEKLGPNSTKRNTKLNAANLISSGFQMVLSIGFVVVVFSGIKHAFYVIFPDGLFFIPPPKIEITGATRPTVYAKKEKDKKKKDPKDPSGPASPSSGSSQDGQNAVQINEGDGSKSSTDGKQESKENNGESSQAKIQSRSISQLFPFDPLIVSLLAQHEIVNQEALVSRSPEELKKIKGIGEQKLLRIRQILSMNQLALKDDSEWNGNLTPFEFTLSMAIFFLPPRISSRLMLEGIETTEQLISWFNSPERLKIKGLGKKGEAFIGQFVKAIVMEKEKSQVLSRTESLEQESSRLIKVLESHIGRPELTTIEKNLGPVEKLGVSSFDRGVLSDLTVGQKNALLENLNRARESNPALLTLNPGLILNILLAFVSSQEKSHLPEAIQQWKQIIIPTVLGELNNVTQVLKSIPKDKKIVLLIDTHESKQVRAQLAAENLNNQIVLIEVNSLFSLDVAGKSVLDQNSLEDYLLSLNDWERSNSLVGFSTLTLSKNSQNIFENPRLKEIQCLLIQADGVFSLSYSNLLTVNLLLQSLVRTQA